VCAHSCVSSIACSIAAGGRSFNIQNLEGKFSAIEYVIKEEVLDDIE